MEKKGLRAGIKNDSKVRDELCFHGPISGLPWDSSCESSAVL